MTSFGRKKPLSLLYAPDYLQELRTNRTMIGLAVMLKFTSITAMIGFAVLVLPILRKFGYKLSIGYLGLRFIELGIIIIGSIKLMSLVSLSQKLIDDGKGDSFYGNILVNSIVAEWEWIGFIYMFVLVLHCFAFYYLLLKSNLIHDLFQIVVC